MKWLLPAWWFSQEKPQLDTSVLTFTKHSQRQGIDPQGIVCQEPIPGDPDHCALEEPGAY